MDMQLRSDADQPYGQAQIIKMQEPVQLEDPVINWIKLIALILMTFGLIACMWEICTAIYGMHGSVYYSWIDAGGLLLGLFCFYVLVFGGAWCWGYRQRDELKRQVVEKQIARQRAIQAMAGLE